MNPDLGNAIFEAGGALLLWFNVRALYRDKQLRGVALGPTLWYQTWGAWNLWYYHAIGQTWSWLAGFGVFLANSMWVGLALWYRYKARVTLPAAVLRTCRIRCPGHSAEVRQKHVPFSEPPHGQVSP